MPKGEILIEHEHLLMKIIINGNYTHNITDMPSTILCTYILFNLILKIADKLVAILSLEKKKPRLEEMKGSAQGQIGRRSRKQKMNL